MPAQASSAWMRREKAGWVTWRSWAEREKLRVAARLLKSSSHLVSICLLGAAAVLGCARLARRVLQLPHASIAPALRQQRRMRAALDDAAGLHHQDLVRIDHCRQAVG